ncbi:MAG: GDP-mannose 4,6-dehydratase [archaeon]|nr:GDP-mannose 4,6-dehydratase [archaeon]
MKNNVLVTGTTGFVGSHMVDLLLEKGYNVSGIKRWNNETFRNARHFLNDIEWVDCDITDQKSVRSLIKKTQPEKIFNLAAESAVAPSWEHPVHYMDVNYGGTVNLLEAVREFSPDTRILIPGSGEEYGDIHEDELPINEDTILRPVNPYSVTKIAQDLIGYVYFRSYGTNVIRTRAFNHEGPRRDYFFGVPWYAYQIAKIEQGKQESIIKVGHVDDKRNFTHVKDLVEAYNLAMEKCNPGELYLIGNENPDNIHTFKEVLENLLDMSDLDRSQIRIETDPKYVRPTSVPRLIGDTRKFRELTGWEPKRSFNDILTDTLEYWRTFVKEDLY